MKENKKIESKDTKLILDAMHQFFKDVDKRFDGIDKRFDRIEATMVTKDYLDEKLADLRGDLVVLIRKEDTKLNALLSLLKNKKVINENEAGKITTMEPFSKIA